VSATGKHDALRGEEAEEEAKPAALIDGTRGVAEATERERRRKLWSRNSVEFAVFAVVAGVFFASRGCREGSSAQEAAVRKALGIGTRSLEKAKELEKKREGEMVEGEKQAVAFFFFSTLHFLLLYLSL